MFKEKAGPLRSGPALFRSRHQSNDHGCYAEQCSANLITGDGDLDGDFE